MKKIKLMQITHDLAIGGLQQVVINLCKAINRDIFDLSVLCIREMGVKAAELEQIGIPVMLLPQKRNGSDYFAFLKVAKILKENKTELIHTHNTQPFVDGAIGGVLAGVTNIIHTDHARNFPDKKRYMFAEWVVSHFVKKIVGVSDHTGANLVKYEKISPKKLVTIYNGIDISKYNIKINKEAKKDSLGIGSRSPIIGLGARLSEQKGLTYLLQAMPEVIRVFPDIVLFIAGEGPLEADLKNETERLKINRNVLFAGPRLDFPDILNLFDLFVLPSLWEGFPMVLLEAMAAGCPILSTDVGGVSECIRHDYNGALITPRSNAELSSAIIRLLSNKELMLQYSQNNSRLVSEKYSIENMAREYEKLYLQYCR